MFSALGKAPEYAVALHIWGWCLLRHFHSCYKDPRKSAGGHLTPNTKEGGTKYCRGSTVTETGGMTEEDNGRKKPFIKSLPRNLGYLVLSRECTFLGSLSRHNKDLEWRTLKPPRRVAALRSWIDCIIALRSRMDCVIALRQINVTAQCYSSILFRR